VVLTGPSHVAYDNYDGYNGHDGHDVHDSHDNHLCYYDDYLSHREDRDDDTITIDSRTETTEVLTVLAADDTTQTKLLNRWIVDLGSNTYVFNTEAWQG
jgi:hypothetical protein